MAEGKSQAEERSGEDREREENGESRDLEHEGEEEGKAEREPDEKRDDGDRDKDDAEEHEHSRPGITKMVFTAIGAVLFTLLGLWIFAGLIAPGYISSIVLGVIWFVLCSWLIGRFWKRYPGLKWPARGAFLVTAVAIIAVVAATSLRDKTVHEKVVTGVKLSDAPQTAKVPKKPKKPAPKQPIEVASGNFEDAEEGTASGHAALVQLPDQSLKVTITDLDVAPGPDLRVYLVPGNGKDVSHKLDLGGLKGNKGDQQYSVPRGTDTGAFQTVVVYCRAFSVAFGRAQLKAG